MKQNTRSLNHTTLALERLEDRTVPSANLDPSSVLLWQDTAVAVTVDSVILTDLAQAAMFAATGDSSSLLLPVLLASSPTPQQAQETFDSLLNNSQGTSLDPAAASSPTDAAPAQQTGTPTPNPANPSATGSQDSTGGSGGNKGSGNPVVRLVGRVVDQVGDLATLSLASSRPHAAPDSLDEDAVSVVSGVRADLGPPNRSLDTALPGVQALGVLPPVSLLASAAVGGNVGPTVGAAIGVTGLTGRSGPVPMLAGGDGGVPPASSRFAQGSIGFDVRALSSSGLDIVPVPVRGEEGASASAQESTDAATTDAAAALSGTRAESGRDVRVKQFLLGVDAPGAGDASGSAGDGFSQAVDIATDFNLPDAILIALWDADLSGTVG